MMNELKKYRKELRECLDKFDVIEMKKFVRDHKYYFDKAYRGKFYVASDDVIYLTMCNLIFETNGLKKETYEKASAFIKQWEERKIAKMN